jgi:hypothetical protein
VDSPGGAESRRVIPIALDFIVKSANSGFGPTGNPAMSLVDGKVSW